MWSLFLWIYLAVGTGIGAALYIVAAADMKTDVQARAEYSNLFNRSGFSLVTACVLAGAVWPLSFYLFFRRS